MAEKIGRLRILSAAKALEHTMLHSGDPEKRAKAREILDDENLFLDFVRIREERLNGQNKPTETSFLSRFRFPFWKSQRA